MHHTIPYIAGGLTTLGTYLAQATPSGLNAETLVPVGMAGVVMVLLLKFFPMTLDKFIAALAEKDAQHQEAMKELFAVNREINKDWQKVVSEKKICPKDENGN